MYYVYLLLSLKDYKFYIGFTTDLRKRLADHNSGINKSTAHRVPFKLIYYEAYLNRLDAIRRERFLKSGRGREIIKKQLENFLGEVAEWSKAPHC